MASESRSEQSRVDKPRAKECRVEERRQRQLRWSGTPRRHDGIICAAIFACPWLYTGVSDDATLVHQKFRRCCVADKIRTQWLTHWPWRGSSGNYGL